MFISSTRGEGGGSSGSVLSCSARFEAVEEVGGGMSFSGLKERGGRSN